MRKKIRVLIFSAILVALLSGFLSAGTAPALGGEPYMTVTKWHVSQRNPPIYYTGEYVTYIVQFVHTYPGTAEVTFADEIPYPLEIGNAYLLPPECEGFVYWWGRTVEGFWLHPPEVPFCRVYIQTRVQACQCWVANAADWCAYWDGYYESGTATDPVPIFLSHWLNSPPP